MVLVSGSDITHNSFRVLLGLSPYSRHCSESDGSSEPLHSRVGPKRSSSSQRSQSLSDVKGFDGYVTVSWKRRISFKLPTVNIRSEHDRWILTLCFWVPLNTILGVCEKLRTSQLSVSRSEPCWSHCIFFFLFFWNAIRRCALIYRMRDERTV